jgi:two-component system sensor histidine kinase/response regulator
MIADKGNILIVDDTPDNLRLLSAMLSQRGYKVRKALNGQTALKTAQTVPPDLILLDINMPGMNGYEVCQALKAQEQTRDIPVIFISALDDVLDKVRAFQVGGVDYISKPFQGEEVLVRVANQLTIRQQQRQLQAQNEQLQQEVRDRQRVEETLRFYLRAVSHDLRNPVLGMSLVLKNLLKRQSSTTPGDLPAQTLSVPLAVIERMAHSCDRQLHLLDSLVAVQQLESEGVSLNCQPLNLHALVQHLTAEWEPVLAQHQATLENQVPADLPPVSADVYQLWRVLENLIANALKHNPPGVHIAIAAEVEKNSSSQLKITVADNGMGIAPEQVEGLFDRYRRGTGSQRTTGLGLGLYLCRQIIKAHGGEIGAIADLDAGAQFWFTLPMPSA